MKYDICNNKEAFLRLRPKKLMLWIFLLFALFLPFCCLLSFPEYITMKGFVTEKESGLQTSLNLQMIHQILEEGEHLKYKNHLYDFELIRDGEITMNEEMGQVIQTVRFIPEKLLLEDDMLYEFQIQLKKERLYQKIKRMFS